MKGGQFPSSCLLGLSRPELEGRDDFDFQEFDQLGGTALVLVRNMESNDLVVVWTNPVLLSDALAMMRLHHEYQVCACHKLPGKRPQSFTVCARRHGLNTRPVPEQIFRSRASQSVGGADKKDFHSPQKTQVLDNVHAWRRTVQLDHMAMQPRYGAEILFERSDRLTQKGV